MEKVGKPISIKHGKEQHKFNHYNKTRLKLVTSPLVDGYMIQMSPDMFQGSSDDESDEHQPEVDSLSCNSGKPPSNLSSLYSQDNEQIEALSKKVEQLESENGLLHSQIDDLNNQINHLKGELKQHSNGKRKRTSNEQHVMVPLVVGSHITVQRSELEKVKAIGRVSKDKLNVMVNRLLEAIYSKSFLGSRSLSGGCPKKSKKNEASTNEHRSPGIPKEDLKDIIVFVRKTWENIYGDVLPKIKCPIRLAIKSKLDTERRALKKYAHAVCNY